MKAEMHKQSLCTFAVKIRLKFRFEVNSFKKKNNVTFSLMN